MNEMKSIRITAEEEVLILEHRKKKENLRLRRETEAQILHLASDYKKFLTSKELETTFSTFTDDFGYQAKNDRFMYDSIMKVFRFIDEKLLYMVGGK